MKCDGNAPFNVTLLKFLYIFRISSFFSVSVFFILSKSTKSTIPHEIQMKITLVVRKLCENFQFYIFNSERKSFCFLI